MNLFQFSILIWKICRFHWNERDRRALGSFGGVITYKRRYRLQRMLVSYTRHIYYRYETRRQYAMQYALCWWCLDVTRERCGDEERVASENCSTLWIVYYEIFSGIISFYLCNKHSTLLGVCVRVCLCVVWCSTFWLFAFGNLEVRKPILCAGVSMYVG